MTSQQNSRAMPMVSKLWIALVWMCVPALGQTQTLCRDQETDYLSCETRSKGWLQVRVGTKKSLQLVFPAQKEDSLRRFEGNSFPGVSDLRFIHEDMLYSVALSGTRTNGQGEPVAPPAASIGKQPKGKSRPKRIDCKRVDYPKYAPRYEDLNAILRDRNGETDLLFQFMNPAPSNIKNKL